MSDRRLFVCTRCHQFWSAGSSADACPACGSPVLPVEQDYEEYTSWTQEEKAAFKARYVAEHDLTAAAPVSSASAQSYTTEERSPTYWIDSLDKYANILLAVIVVLALLVLIGSSVMGGGVGFFVGLVLAVAICLVGFAGVAAIKVFLDMARDIKAMRTKMEA